MAEHRDLTGASLHEPKGVENANANEVYHADGIGSGDWVDPLTRVKNLNTFYLTDKVLDISSPGSNAYFYSPFNGTINTLSAILSGPITGADSTLSIYKNGLLQTGTLVVPFSGSGAGVKSVATGLSVAVAQGDVLEVRTNGNSSDTQAAFVSLGLQAI